MFFLQGIPLQFRKLNYDDIKLSYYNLMSLLSDTNINLINTLSCDELFNKVNNDHIIFVIINLNSNCVVGTATIDILNKNTMYNVCIIKEIVINEEYEINNKLYNNFLKYLINYSLGTEYCVKYIVK